MCTVGFENHPLNFVRFVRFVSFVVRKYIVDIRWR